MGLRRLFRLPLSPARQAERDIEEELRLHLDLRTEELMREGMSEEQARREAERAFGDPERARRALVEPERRRLRRKNAGEWLGDVARDVRHGARSLLRAPGFTTVAVLTLALGIGANTALFSVVDAVLLEPLPFAEPDELAMVWEAHAERGPEDRNVVNPGNYLDWRERARSFESLAAAWQVPVTVLTGGQPREVPMRIAHPDYFRTLGVSPRLGRAFTAEEAAFEPGDAQVVLLSDAFWRDHFGADPGIIGRRIDLADSRVEVIGVLPPEVEVVAPDVALWMPTDFAWGNREDMGRFISVLGRLAPGATQESAQREMEGIAAQLRAEYPDFNTNWSVNVVPLNEQLKGDVRTALLVILAAVGVLLLVACVNVANLLMVRAAARRTEITVRASLGAGRGRIARGLMIESLVLAAFGAVLGVGFAYLATRALVATVPAALSVPRLAQASVDPSVLGFAAAAALLTGLLFGVAPVLEAFRTDLMSGLREGGRGGGGAKRSRRARASMVIAEVALSLLLLAAAGLLLRSFVELQRTDLGFQPERVVTGRVTLRGEGYDGPGRVAFYDEAVRRIEALPGVQHVGVISWLPLGGGLSATSYFRPDLPRPLRGDGPSTQVQYVQGDAFRALGIPLLRGRTFDARDHAESPGVAVVNRAFAEQTWPGEDPIGRHFILPWGEDRDLEVIGVVGDTRHKGVEQAGEPTVYMPHAQFTQFLSASIVARTSGDPAALQRQIVDRIHAIDPNLAVADLMAMSDVVADAVARPRLTSLLVALFAALALLLAAIGIYGVVSYTVALRARELGVRRALGAQTGDVARIVIGDALKLGGAGIAIGAVVALLATRVLESLLYGVRPNDPLVFAATAATLLAVTLLAALVPALRATRVSPTEAIRYE